MASESDRGEQQYRVKDPLGVIQKAAEQIWKERGAPAGTSWRDFFAEAEELLLAGRAAGAGKSPKNPAEEHRPSDPELLPPEIWTLRDQDYDPFAAAIAWGLQGLLNEHEAFCFATLLESNEFQLAGGQPRACSDEEIVVLLSALAGEYDEDFVKREGRGDLSSIPNEKRCEYWRGKLLEWRTEDRALNFHDRNTINRLRDAITRQPVIEAIRFRGVGQ